MSTLSNEPIGTVSMSKAQGWALLVIGLVCVLAAALILYYSNIGWHLGSRGTSPLPAYGITLTPSPIATLHTVSDDPKQLLTEVLLPDATGKSLRAIDEITHADGSADYILITDPTLPATQVFSKSKEGVVTQRTQSPTVKFGLSVDPSSRAIAYITSPIVDLTKGKPLQDAKAVVLKDGKELTIGPAKVVSVLEGGNRIVIGTEKSFILMSADGSSPHTLLTVPDETAMAIDAHTHTLAVVNHTSLSVDTFSFALYGTASYIRSFPLNALTPQALALSGDQPLLASTAQTASSTELRITNLSTAVNQHIEFPGRFPFVPSRISLTHE